MAAFGGCYDAALGPGAKGHFEPGGDAGFERRVCKSVGGSVGAALLEGNGIGGYGVEEGESGQEPEKYLEHDG